MPFLSSSLIIKCSMTMIYQIQFGRMPVIIMMKKLQKKYYSVDISWGYIGKMKDCIGRIGRVFSMVKKNETPFRASMSFNTLGFILTVKLANPNATKFKPEKTPLNSAKSETSEYNKRHSSSSSSITTKNVEKKMMSLFFF